MVPTLVSLSPPLSLLLSLPRNQRDTIKTCQSQPLMLSALLTLYTGQVLTGPRGPRHPPFPLGAVLLSSPTTPSLPQRCQTHACCGLCTGSFLCWGRVFANIHVTSSLKCHLSVKAALINLLKIATHPPSHRILAPLYHA